MKTIKILLFTLLINTLISCGNYLDKPITEELSETELKKSLGEINPSMVIDSTLYVLVEEYKLIKDTLNSNIELKNKISKLTYKDLVNWSLRTNNKDFNDSIRKIAKQKHKEEYGSLIKKIDSLSDSYYLNPIKLEDYVKVELAKVDTEYYEYSGGIRNVWLDFRLKPLKGTIQQIIFEYTFKRKIGGKEYSNRCVTSKPFSRSVIRSWKLDYSTEKILGGETPYTIKRDYDFEIQIEKIRYKNENLSNDEMDIPFEIRQRKKYSDENDLSMVDYYNEKLAKEIFKTTYEEESDLYRKIKSEILKSETPQYDLISEYIEILMVQLFK